MGPAGKAIGSAIHGAGQQAKQTSEIQESYPVVGKINEKGVFQKLGDYKRIEKTLNMTNVEPKESIWQKFGKIIVIVGILCLIFPTLGVWLFSQTLKLKGNFKQLVVGIEEAKAKLPPESVSILETNLSKKMDTPAKKEVKQIKAKL
jgi:hypothetical protein